MIHIETNEITSDVEVRLNGDENLLFTELAWAIINIARVERLGMGPDDVLDVLGKEIKDLEE